MKRFAVFGALFLGINLLQSQQNYIPFVGQNKYWFYMTSNGADGNPHNLAAYSIWFAGDTVISNINYVKVNKSFLKGTNPCPFPPCFTPNLPYEFEENNNIVGFIREDTIEKLVYYLPNYESIEECTNSEYELYNFNLNIGDSISSCHKKQMSKYYPISNSFGVIETSEIELLFKKNRRVQTFTVPSMKWGLPAFDTVKLIEGVGMTYFDPIYYTNDTKFMDFCEGSLAECNIISKIDFVKNVNLYPNPTNGIIKLHGMENIMEIYLLDYNGIKRKLHFTNNEIDITDIHQGVYFIEVVDDNYNRQFKKIVKL